MEGRSFIAQITDVDIVNMTNEKPYVKIIIGGVFGFPLRIKACNLYKVAEVLEVNRLSELKELYINVVINTDNEILEISRAMKPRTIYDVKKEEVIYEDNGYQE